MPIYNIQDPSTGKTVSIQGDTPPSESDLDGIFKTVHGQSSDGGSTAPESNNWFQDLSNAANTRLSNAKAALNDPNLNPVAAGIKSVGQGAGFLADAALSTIKRGVVDPMVYAGSALEPAGMYNAMNNAGNSIQGAVTPIIGAGLKKWAGFSENNPNIAASAEGLANIAGVLPMGEVGGALAGGGRAALGGTLRAVGGGLEGASKGITPVLAKLALKESPLSVPAMESGSTASGRALMAANTGKEAEIGRSLLENLSGDKFSAAIAPENSDISMALKNTPSISLDNTIQALENSKISGDVVLPHEAKANQMIDQYIASLKTKTPSPSANYKAPKMSSADMQAAANQMFEKELAEQEQLNAVHGMALNHGKKADIAKYTDNAIGLKNGGHTTDILGQDILQDDSFNGYTNLDSQGNMDPNDFASYLDEAVGRKLNKTEFTPKVALQKYKAQMSSRNGFEADDYANYLKTGAEDNTLAHADMINNIRQTGAHPLNEYVSITKSSDPAKPFSIAGVDIPQDLAVSLSAQARANGGALSLEDASATMNDYFSSTGKPQAKTLPASQFLNLRQRLDSRIPWDDPSKQLVDAALTNGRQAMASDLITNAPEGYKSAMSDLAQKMQARDQILNDIPGKNIADKMDNVESYVRNIHGIGKTEKAAVLKQIDDIFGTDYYNQSYAAALGKQFGETGIPGLVTRHGTGYGATQVGGALEGLKLASEGHILPALGGFAVGAAQSPLVGTRIIGGLRSAGQGLQGLGNRVLPLYPSNSILNIPLNPAIGSLQVGQ